MPHSGPEKKDPKPKPNPVKKDDKKDPKKKDDDKKEKGSDPNKKAANEYEKIFFSFSFFPSCGERERERKEVGIDDLIGVYYFCVWLT